MVEQMTRLGEVGKERSEKGDKYPGSTGDYFTLPPIYL
jgi:hypothetical protein